MVAPSLGALLAVSLSPTPYISWENLFKTQEEQMKAFLCEPRKSKSLLTQNKQTNQVGAPGSLVAQLEKCRRSGFNPWVGKIP